MSGAWTAFAVGALTYAAGAFAFTAVLLAFFLPSVALSRVGRRRKRELVDIGKGGARDALQVLANGGVATACAVVYAFTHDARWAAAFAGAYAAATADTWATEIGTLARNRPRSILTLRPLGTGLSGGVTLPGTLAEVAGAGWLGATAGLAFGALRGDLPLQAGWPLVPAAIAGAGVIGATVDSLLGASLQELRRCDSCGRTCETNPHACGAATVRVRGVAGFTNDLVNLVATAAGAAAAGLLAG